jgi:hypothetical protein
LGGSGVSGTGSMGGNLSQAYKALLLFLPLSQFLEVDPGWRRGGLAFCLLFYRFPSFFFLVYVVLVHFSFLLLF